MSTKSTVILSDSNEHWYTDCGGDTGYPFGVMELNGKFKDPLILEIGRDNYVEGTVGKQIPIGDWESLCICISPDSNLYKALEEVGFIK